MKQNNIKMNKVTIIEGDPNSGKSTVARKLASQFKANEVVYLNSPRKPNYIGPFFYSQCSEETKLIIFENVKEIIQFQMFFQAPVCITINKQCRKPFNISPMLVFVFEWALPPDHFIRIDPRYKEVKIITCPDTKPVFKYRITHMETGRGPWQSNFIYASVEEIGRGTYCSANLDMILRDFYGRRNEIENYEEALMMFFKLREETINKLRKSISRDVLIKAVSLIQFWHNIRHENDERMWQIYYDLAPEMNSIREELGPYNKLKREITEEFSATAALVNGRVFSKKEAIKLMLKGHKVRHRYFEEDEYMEIPWTAGLYRLSGRHVISDSLFWKDREGECWEKDWELVNQ